MGKFFGKIGKKFSPLNAFASNRLRQPPPGPDAEALTFLNETVPTVSGKQGSCLPKAFPDPSGRALNSAYFTSTRFSMKITKFLALGLAAALAAGCQLDTDNSRPVYNLVFDFNAGVQGWSGGFTDYAVVQDSAMFEFKLGQTKLPTPLDTTKKGFRIEGMNRSDDLFMFIKTKLTGLAPNTVYDTQFSVDFASMYGDSLAGIGGSPAQSVYLKAGATGTEPVKVRNGDMYVLNVDKGNQSTGGKDAVLLGDVSIGNTGQMQYKTINRNNGGGTPLKAKTNDKGELWLFIGTDSGFEGLTTLYYQRVRVLLTPALTAAR